MLRECFGTLDGLVPALPWRRAPFSHPHCFFKAHGGGNRWYGMWGSNAAALTSHLESMCDCSGVSAHHGDGQMFCVCVRDDVIKMFDLGPLDPIRLEPATC